MDLVFATHNHNKIKEITPLLPQSIRLLSLDDIGCTEEIEETENTLEGNAALKATYVAQNYHYACFADDTGLMVDALNGDPGIFSARYAGSQKSAEDNMNKLLRNLGDVEQRKAHFKTVIALQIDGALHLFEGIVTGEILREKKGTEGFGYDPLFKPDGYTKTFAELPMSEKNKISHRARALEKLILFLESYSTNNKS
ncbi:MAG: non-canonical purine NTP diphosphatase [Flavobacteriaceae bacterium]